MDLKVCPYCHKPHPWVGKIGILRYEIACRRCGTGVCRITLWRAAAAWNRLPDIFVGRGLHKNRTRYWDHWRQG